MANKRRPLRSTGAGGPGGRGPTACSMRVVICFRRVEQRRRRHHPGADSIQPRTPAPPAPLPPPGRRLTYVTNQTTDHPNHFRPPGQGRGERARLVPPPDQVGRTNTLRITSRVIR